MKTQRINTQAPALTRGILTAAAAMILWVGTNPALAALLTGTGTHLILPPFVTPFPGVAPTYTAVPSTSFTGTWGTSALAAWQGTFVGSGPIPIGANPSGASSYDFLGIGSGLLPAYTSFIINDLDTVEHFTLKAYDVAGTPLTEWLDTPLRVAGTGSGSGGAPVSNDMPGWAWDLATFTYTFDGTTIPGNPNIVFAMENNQAMRRLDVNRDISSFSFNLVAPVPEPSMALFAGSFGALFFLRRSRSRTAA